MLIIENRPKMDGLEVLEPTTKLTKKYFLYANPCGFAGTQWRIATTQGEWEAVTVNILVFFLSSQFWYSHLHNLD